MVAGLNFYPQAFFNVRLAVPQFKRRSCELDLPFFDDISAQVFTQPKGYLAVLFHHENGDSASYSRLIIRAISSTMMGDDIMRNIHYHAHIRQKSLLVYSDRPTTT